MLARVRRRVTSDVRKMFLKVRNIPVTLSSEEYVVANWYQSANWGDALNPYLIERISGKKVVHVSEVFTCGRIPVYSVVGSILGTYSSNNLVVWGSGFISHNRRLKRQPRQILAVRGPLTRRALIEQGYRCPEIYGDPALLLPWFIKPSTIEKKYKLGIVPHFIDNDSPYLDTLLASPEVCLIDICAGIHEVVDAIAKCEMVVSSSLHGIICADAYGVPSIWMKLSDRVIGGDFKFQDYFMSVGRKVRQPLVITEKTTLEMIMDQHQDYKIDVDLEALWEVCPLKSF